MEVILLSVTTLPKGLWQCDCYSTNLCKLVSYRLCGESSGVVLARTVSVTVLGALWVSPWFVPRDCIPAVSQQLTQHMHMSAAQAETCILPQPKGVIRRKPFPQGAQYARFVSGRPWRKKNTVESMLRDQGLYALSLCLDMFDKKRIETCSTTSLENLSWFEPAAHMFSMTDHQQTLTSEVMNA